MALDFPSNPTVGQVYTAPNGTTWTWDGTKWTATSGSGTFFLPLSGGILAGPGNLTVKGSALIGPGGTLPSPAGSLTLNLNAGPPPAGNATNLYVVGADNASTTMGMDCFNAAPGGGNYFATRRARGTAAAPAAVQSGDLLLSIQTTGYGTSYGVGNGAGFQMQAAENWGATARGTTMYLQTTNIGASTPVNSLVLQGNGATFVGGVGVGSAATAPGNGTLTLNANTVAPPAGLTGNLMITAPNSSACLLTMDSFTAYNSIAMRGARGTAASPAALQANDTIVYVGANGRGATTYTEQGHVQIAATENWTDTARGTAMYLGTTITGTTTGVNSLILAGNAATFSGTVSVAVGNSLYWGTPAASTVQINANASTMYLVTSSANSLVLQGNTATFSGSVTAASTFVANVPAGQTGLQVNQSDANTNTNITFQSPAPRIWSCGVTTGSGTPPSGFYIGDNTAALTRLSISTAGACAASSTWSVISDSSLKDQIEDHPHGLAEILQLQPRRFRMVDDDRVATGLIAQELEAVMPDLVGEMEIGEGRTVKTVTEAGVIWPLVNAVKELAAANDELRQRLVALERKR